MKTVTWSYIVNNQFVIKRFLKLLMMNRYLRSQIQIEFTDQTTLNAFAFNCTRNHSITFLSKFLSFLALSISQYS